jgi:crotonobetainyl-CoA:carnitine CoA-transferase CaiB-like acyl-CoA transferase
VVASVNGFGSDGRLKDRTAFDSIAQAMSGLMDVTRGADDKPLVSGAFLADIAAGNHAAMGVVMALFERTRTGMGQSLEVSLLDSAISYLGLAVPAAGAGLETLARRGSRDPLRSPATVFPALDGFVFIHAGVEPVWIRLAIAIGRKDLLEDERFRGYQARLANVAELESEISAWTSGRSQADIVSALSAADIPCGPVNTVAQAIGDEDVLGRGAVRRYEFDGFGSMPLPGFPIRMGGTWTPIAAPRGCGADTIEILAGELGMAQDEIADLLDRGIVALPPASDIQGHQDAVDQA